MRSTDLLNDAYSRIHDVVHRAVDGLKPDELAFRVDPEANTIAWLVWHLTRIQDDHVADVAGHEQVWTAGGWAERFGLPFDNLATGFGHSPAEVALVQVDSAELLTAYFDAVHERSTAYVGALTDDDLDRVVDEAWDPPVTLGVRLVSVVSDNLQHAGQAAYLRGVVTRSQ